MVMIVSITITPMEVPECAIFLLIASLVLLSSGFLPVSQMVKSLANFSWSSLPTGKVFMADPEK